MGHSTEAPYIDPKTPSNSINTGSPMLSTITIKWNDGDNFEKKLERIITQKWIALYPDGPEAWAEQRRTGYPIIFQKLPFYSLNAGFRLGLAQKRGLTISKRPVQVDIDVDATKFTYLGKQSIQYTNNSPDELKVIYMHLYWNAFKSGSMMDERVRNQGKNSDKRLQKDGVSRLTSIPADQEGRQNIHWIKQNGRI
ncbi:hypothetical protein FQR65_LT18355 [Abscondita terminalis]|nr:hypothetical protein FQR65_LT18355 [Abscondita terminalis]